MRLPTNVVKYSKTQEKKTLLYAFFSRFFLQLSDKFDISAVNDYYGVDGEIMRVVMKVVLNFKSSEKGKFGESTASHRRVNYRPSGSCDRCIRRCKLEENSLQQLKFCRLVFFLILRETFFFILFNVSPHMISVSRMSFLVRTQLLRPNAESGDS